jgi:outer membrane protein assembly factor BamD
VRTMKLPEAGKARLEKIYDDQAAAAYTKVVLEHSAAPHVEDARDRLEAMNLPIPTPTPEQMAASLALENSRRQYRLQDRVGLMFMHKADVVLAARDGDPSLTDASPTLAPHITTKIIADFKDAMNPNAGKPAPSAATDAPAADPNATAPTSAEAAPAAAPATPLQFQDVPTADAGTSGSAVMTSVPGNTTATPPPAGNSMGVEILSTGASSGTTGTTAKPGDTNGGLTAVGPPNATPLPVAEKATGTPDVVNDVQSHPQPAAQAPNANGKKTKPAFDKSDESSSKHKKKKGLSKLNPF